MAEPSVPETVEPINQRPWRELFGVHPAAELFPPLSPAEIADLAADMKQRGMLVPLLMYRRDDGGLDVVDGRGRLDAFTLAGLANPQVLHDYGDNDSTVWLVLSDDDDPWAVAIAANAKRRHLTAAMRREAIGKYVALRPEQSDRQIAAMFAVDHKTVGAVRKQGVATGEISPVERTTGADGKSRPVVRKAPVKTVPVQTTPVQTTPVQTTPTPTRAAALDQATETRRGTVEEVQAEARARKAIWIRQVHRNQIAEFVAGFGIAGDDLERLFRLFRVRETDIIVEDPAGYAAELVAELAVDFALEYVFALQGEIDRHTPAKPTPFSTMVEKLADTLEIAPHDLDRLHKLIVTEELEHIIREPETFAQWIVEEIGVDDAHVAAEALAQAAHEAEEAADVAEMCREETAELVELSPVARGQKLAGMHPNVRGALFASLSADQLTQWEAEMAATPPPIRRPE